MPYRYELQNQQHFRHAVVTGVALASLLLLLALAPAKILAWSGLALGSLSVPESQPVAAQQISVGRLGVAIQAPPAIEPYTFPAYAEWSDLETTSCVDCDSTFSYGVDGALDAVDNQSLDSLERSSQLGAGTLGASSPYRSGASSAPTGLGAGGAAGASSPATEASEESDTASEAPVQTDGTDEAEEAGSEAAASAAAVGSGSSGGDSSGGGSSVSGSSASDSGSGDSSDSGSSDALAAGDGSAVGSASGAETTLEETNLVLSPVSPVADEAATGGSGGGSPAIDAAAPQEVVHALAEGPVGAETVHALGEADAIEALLDLENVAAVSETSDAGGQQQIVPEPTSLLLMGLALTAVVFRLRRRVVRP